MTKQRAFVALLAMVAVILSATVVEAQGNRGRSNFDWIVARRLTITALGLSVVGGATVDGDITADSLTLAPATTTTVTTGGTLTPSAGFHPISAAGTVGVGLGVCPAGLVTIIENTVNQTITITDTGTSKLAGNFAMGQFDTLTVIGDGTNCYEVSRSNN